MSSTILFYLMSPHQR